MSKCVKIDTKNTEPEIHHLIQQYISKSDKNGIYKWVKLVEKSKSSFKIYSYKKREKI